MHELTLINDLLNKIEALARAQQSPKIVSLTLQLGPLAHISPEHLRHHFYQAAAGTVAEGARLDITLLGDITHPQAQDIILTTLEFEA
ncbi:MAG: hydrogenase nickel incorporation protein HypA [Desulfobacca sp. 4484_104]|nr:MAG: hydrogenase nickel incorporation protein HypA [Desulfobacca sp. 4484_104]RLA89641.1 MAG: hydrogenase maturation nickel metallochaperone HypA [Deltaproteobacteria bacterium]